MHEAFLLPLSYSLGLLCICSQEGLVKLRLLSPKVVGNTRSGLWPWSDGQDKASRLDSTHRICVSTAQSASAILLPHKVLFDMPATRIA